MEFSLTSLINVLPFGLMIGLMYLLTIRPQQKKMHQHQEMLSHLKKGDQVITSSGLVGKLTHINDQYVHLSITDGVIVTLQKQHITALFSEK